MAGGGQNSSGSPNYQGSGNGSVYGGMPIGGNAYAPQPQPQVDPGYGQAQTMEMHALPAQLPNMGQMQQPNMGQTGQQGGGLGSLMGGQGQGMDVIVHGQPYQQGGQQGGITTLMNQPQQMNTDQMPGQFPYNMQ